MSFVWVTIARGVMAIGLGLALALNGDRAPAALVNFRGIELGLGATLLLTAEQEGSLSTWIASAWALVGGTVLLFDALARRRRLLAAASGEAGQRSHGSTIA